VWRAGIEILSLSFKRFMQRLKAFRFPYCKFTPMRMDNGKHVHIKVQVSEENANLLLIWDKVSPVLRNRRSRRPY
jgi:hypothetical protein